METNEDIEKLEFLLDVAVEAGEVEHVKGICSTFHKFYSKEIAEIDNTSGRALGNLFTEEYAGLSVFDKRREDYMFELERFTPNSYGYQNMIQMTEENCSE